MNDNPLDRLPSFDRVSIRAVVVNDDEDPSQALMEAGILDPIAIPVVFGEDQPDFSFGDGITPNLTAVLELDQEVDEPDQEVDELSFTAQPARIHDSQGQDGASQKARPATATLPTAYGSRPLAPVRPRGS